MDALTQILGLVILIYSVVLHEVAHGLTARSMGDRTAEQMGRLTLNPLPHLDLFGSVLLPIMLYFANAPIFGYAKPVPYDPANLSDKRWGPAKVGLAGPLTNVVLAVLAGMVVRFAGGLLNEVALGLVATIVLINLSLAVFNLIPIPPLDGHWLLMALLPRGHTGLRIALYRYQWVLLIAAIFIIFPLLVPLIYSGFSLLTGMPSL